MGYLSSPKYQVGLILFTIGSYIIQGGPNT
jgi:hypothetical protein